MGGRPILPDAALCLVVAAVVAVAVADIERPKEEEAAPTTPRGQRPNPVGTVAPATIAQRGLEPTFAGADPRVWYFKGVALNRGARYREALFNLWLAETAGIGVRIRFVFGDTGRS